MTEKKKIIAEQESVFNNGKVLLEKRGKLIEQFAKNNIISKDENFMMLLKRVKKAYQRNQSKNLINQFLNGCKCWKIDLIS